MGGREGERDGRTERQRENKTMPELPEVETTVRGLARVLDGQAITACA